MQAGVGWSRLELEILNIRARHTAVRIGAPSVQDGLSPYPRVPILLPLEAPYLPRSTLELAPEVPYLEVPSYHS